VSARAQLRQHGFTLIEMAIVVAIFGLVVSGALYGLGAYLEQQAQTQTRRALDDGERALSLFVMQFGRLPCPDTDMDGVEDRAGCGTGDLKMGVLPWQSLGVAREAVRDGWQHFLSYAVTGDVTEDDALDCSTGEANYGAVRDAGRLEPVDDPSGAGSQWPSAAPVPPRAAYVLLSHGSNGFGAFMGGGTQYQSGQGSAGEQHNALVDTSNDRRDNGGFLAEEFAVTAGDDRLRFRTPAQIFYDIGCNHNGAL